jgi:serine protease Do
MKIKFLVVAALFATIARSQSLTELYKEVSSSVVVLEVVSVAPESMGSSVELVAQASQGSGVLISAEGHIWTAAHVVQSAEEVKVEFLDGDVYEADVLTSNEQADVALVKIKEGFQLKNKKVAEIGDSDRLLIGEDVFVLGAPHGFKQSLSRGILSGIYEPENLVNDFVPIAFLQTDAAINPGNSGGPMFNMQGEVVGIASRIFTQSGGFEGIGFAMSSNLANKLLMEEPSLWAGIEFVLINGLIAKALNVPQESGLLITSLSSKGAASELGLQGGFISAIIDGTELVIGGDIILELGGITIVDNNSMFQIRDRLNAYQKGETITMTILRNGKIGTAEFVKQY